MNPGTVPVLRPPREITAGSLAELEAMLLPHLEAGGPGLVLDLEDVAFINSTGLGRLVKVGMRLGEQRRRFALARPERKVERMIRLIGLDRVMPVFKTMEAAADFVEAAGSSAPSTGP